MPVASVHCGSAPRARGTVERQLTHRPAARLSPACAGNGTSAVLTCVTASAQPRVRGERFTRTHSDRVGTGSAPRARGTGAPSISSCSLSRLNPACAGNGRPEGGFPRRCAAQPRVRGERSIFATLATPPRGSAPRARGTVRPRARPATSDTAQPRVRGERMAGLAHLTFMDGSAPRARGTAPHASRECGEVRLSPACAGNGTVCGQIEGWQSAQPRVRGERQAPYQPPAPGGGSAPRARGTAHEAEERGGLLRLSPACAGNGILFALLIPITAAQPRVRGERGWTALRSHVMPGSAPRARGTVACGPMRGGCGRLSPACAGNGPRR